MPHICVRCRAQYPDGSEELLKGCSCGSHFFYFVRQENLDKWKQDVPVLTHKQAKEMEDDVKDIIGVKPDEDVPVILDIETITMRGPGKYLIDLTKLFSGENPIIYKLKDGKYYIDLSSISKGE
jgi:predicted  nucleic acid-binding Zn-ribbon protein